MLKLDDDIGSCVQSYKKITIVIYNSRGVLTVKLFILRL